MIQLLVHQLLWETRLSTSQTTAKLVRGWNEMVKTTRTRSL